MDGIERREGTEKLAEPSTNIPGAPASVWLSPSWVKVSQGETPLPNFPLPSEVGISQDLKI